TVRTRGSVASIPTFTPAAGRSVETYSRVRCSHAGSAARTPATPMVDCTVVAVMAEVPKMPCAAKTDRSAVIPAPLDGSKPAIVRAMAGGRGSVWASKVGDERNHDLEFLAGFPSIL